MKNIVRNLLTLSLVSILSGCSQNSVPQYKGYKLFWNEEFKDAELNEDYWEYMIGDGSPNVGWGNSELEYYTKDNASIRNNQLVITAKREDKGGYHYTSARLRTKGKVAFKYGRVEARMSLPEVTGMWPAFWLLPETSYHNKGWPYNGEIDIMEARGRVNDLYTGAVHYAGPAGGDTYQVVSHSLNGEGKHAKEGKKTYISDFHLYSLEWDEDELRWYFDNELIGSVNERAWKRELDMKDEEGNNVIYSPFDYDFHILINLAVGGHFDDFREPPSDFEEAEMIVDYVRVYQYK